MKKNQAPGSIRIIAGKWRSRKLIVPPVKGLRPTPGRVRETLFNWLSPVISGAYCLDAFAGSGALGFEALSRGAAGVDMIEQDTAVVEILQAEALSFDAAQVRIICGQLPAALKHLNRRYDVVFLDPPFQSTLLLPTCEAMEINECLADDAYIYLEAERPIIDNELPPHWQLLQSKRAGQVYYHLVKRSKK